MQPVTIRDVDTNDQQVHSTITKKADFDANFSNTKWQFENWADRNMKGRVGR